MDKFQILKQYFGYDCFREGQESLITSIVNGQDTLGIMPTGAGKSICYQVPAMMMDGITLVISPLISLMNDQVRALKEVGIAAAYLNSSLTVNQYYKALENAQNGKYRLIYAAPERLLTDSFLDFAKSAHISMVTVDEAHCISQWGQDFRPSYLKIVDFLNSLSRRPVVSAFTATATQTVREDIEKMLELKNPHVVVTGFDRYNLYYEVQHPKNKMEALLAYVKRHEEESGIVYCATRKLVEEVCEVLCRKGYAATRYHAGLSEKEREENQQDFIYDAKPIMVATNAFGMGIDKSNVRYVVHYNMPKNLESYYQEAGRAGRDGEPAECLLLYHGQDVVINQMFIDHSQREELDFKTAKRIRQQDEKRLKQMTYYCLTKDCLREYVLRYFGEQSQHYCGNCSNCLKEYEEVDVSDIARSLIGCVSECGGRYGISTIVDVLRGADNQKVSRGGLKQNSYYGALASLSIHRIRTVAHQLILDGYLITTDGKYPLLQMTRLGKLFLYDVEGFITMKMAKEEYEPKHSTEKTSERKYTESKNRTKKQAASIKGEKKQLFESLRKVRLRLAKENRVPPYIIFSDKTLKDMCNRLPQSEDELLLVNGVGQVKCQKYGRAFIEAIKEFICSNRS